MNKKIIALLLLNYGTLFTSPSSDLALLEINLSFLAKQLGLAPGAPTISGLYTTMFKTLGDTPTEWKKGENPIIPLADFQAALEMATQATKKFHGAHPWKDNNKPDEALYKLEDYNLTLFHTQKLDVSPGTTIAIWGDTHGSGSSLIRELNYLKDKEKILDDSFKIIKPDHFLVFLGDCTDRGLYGVEVWYMLLRLKAANPEHVFIMRGNHEDVEINRRYGFKTQDFDIKYPENKPTYNKLMLFYNLLPVALFLGCNGNYAQYCHGGIEIGYNPKNLLQIKSPICFEKIDTLYRKTNSDELLKNWVVSSEQLKNLQDLKSVLQERLALYNKRTEVLEKEIASLSGQEKAKKRAEMLTIQEKILSDTIELMKISEQIAAITDTKIVKDYFNQPAINFKDQPLQDLTWLIPGLSDSSTLGFCWNDFVVSGNRYGDKLDDLFTMLPALDTARYNTFIENYCIWQRGRGIAFGELLTKRVLSFYSAPGNSVRSIMRGHQHNPTMIELSEINGCFNLWNSTVLTFFSAPEMGFRYLDSFSILTTAANFEDWKISDIWRGDDWKTSTIEFNKEPATSVLEVGKLEGKSPKEEKKPAEKPKMKWQDIKL